MKNPEVASLLNRIADYLEFESEPFKVRAYRKAAIVIEGLSEDIEKIWKENRLTELPGVGEGIARKIDDFLKTGKSKYLDGLKKKMPLDVSKFESIEGIGPKTIIKLSKHLKIKTVDDLEKAAKSGKIQKIRGFGPTVEQNIIKRIQFARQSQKRIPLGYALTSAEGIVNALNPLREVQQISVAGSVRRMKEAIGDIDILVATKNPEKIIDHFTKLPDVVDVFAKGPTRASIKLRSGIQSDIRVVEEKSFGAALLYFTGSKEHNIVLRRIAIGKGMKLSEYGVFGKKNNRMLAGKTEEDVYKKLGLSYIEPEIREAEGEIESAQKNSLPKLIGYDGIKGDLQMHTKWSDGSDSIEEMALEGKKLGYEYICITDHTGNLAIAGALDEKKINSQRKEIDKVNKKPDGIKVLQGVEVNINADGSLDMKDRVLEQLDVVVASVHSGFKMPKEKMTERIILAMQNENVDIIAHPTGRLLTRREAYEFDLDRVFGMARKTNTFMEINAYPERLDLKDSNVRKAVKAGVKLVISTDAHNVDQLKFMKLGIGTARRGWATKDDVANTRNLKDFLRMMK